ITGETGTFYKFTECLLSPAYEWLPKKSKNFTWKILPPANAVSKRQSKYRNRSLDAKLSRVGTI
ncbi:MAG: hypothetical protein MN733_27505, partial [Nitrososphaera sp.]|nr:hypothetical protein [Nitrososphaera sp.]